MFQHGWRESVSNLMRRSSRGRSLTRPEHLHRLGLLGRNQLRKHLATRRPHTRGSHGDRILPAPRHHTCHAWEWCAECHVEWCAALAGLAGLSATWDGGLPLCSLSPSYLFPSLPPPSASATWDGGLPLCSLSPSYLFPSLPPPSASATWD